MCQFIECFHFKTFETCMHKIDKKRTMIMNSQKVDSRNNI